MSLHGCTPCFSRNAASAQVKLALLWAAFLQDSSVRPIVSVDRVLPTLMMVIGFVIAWHFYIRRPDIPVELARQHEVLYKFLLNKWYFDEIYDSIFVRPTMWLGRTLVEGRRRFVIDGFGPDGVSARVLDVTRNVMRLQTGYLYHYAFAMLIGAAAFITWFMFAGALMTTLAHPLGRHLPAARRGGVHHAGARQRPPRQEHGALGGRRS